MPFGFKEVLSIVCLEIEVYRGGPSEQGSGDLSVYLAPLGIQGKLPRAPGRQRICCPSFRGPGEHSASRPVVRKWHLYHDSGQSGDFQDTLSASLPLSAL